MDEFIEQDKTLETQAYNLNGKIRQINENKKQIHSPNFSTDLVKKTQKLRKTRKRKTS